ncbi:recombination regulator RecX [Aquibacillus salsiterrae]|uniref:Regulatory protein RecX n=1 Tax=Aquibacillus salsiterrae TaxID=2950439 RepID=A0A9X4AHH0_9BACI|nr:recombination regulator RecX [Aquibacillus salsiterrae]MDC3418193.1 recombination regulator RecX [Aquibacillus salsiterrae]
MVKISRISTQQKNKSRYNIFLEDERGDSYGFSVDEDILVEFSLHKGMEMDGETVELLKQKDTIHKSYALAINYLSYRMRSKKEISDYLTKKDIDAEQVHLVMDRLSKEGLLDDQAFANAFVETRINTSSKGPQLVKKELLEKGISTQIADEALKKISYDWQYDKAEKLTRKKWSSTNNKSFQQQQLTVKQHLIQKGFSHDVIKDVLTEFVKETDDDSEWQALVHQGEKFVRKYEQKFVGYELKQKVKGGLYRKGFPIDLIERFLDECMEEQM